MKPRKRSRTTRLHFNKINERRGNPNVWTLHERGVCRTIPRVIINDDIETTFRPDAKESPRAWITIPAVSVEADVDGTLQIETPRYTALREFAGRIYRKEVLYLPHGDGMYIECKLCDVLSWNVEKHYEECPILFLTRNGIVPNPYQENPE